MMHPRLPTAAAALALGLFALTASQAGAKPPPPASIAVPRATAHGVMHPLAIAVRGTTAGGAPLFTNTTPQGYVPTTIRAYLGLTGDGRGETIGIVSAFRHPTISSDLDQFSRTFGLPLACGTAGADPRTCIRLRTIVDPSTPTDAGWALETALDVEWAHAIAPRADLVLVEARDDELPTMMQAIATARRAGATVISASWGTDETRAEHRYDHQCRHPAALCVVASGNSGNPAAYPAASAGALAVGGTSLSLDLDGAVLGESAWTGSGGGVSPFERRPPYQDSVQTMSGRGIPDVSYNADPRFGVAVYSSVPFAGQDGWFSLGGTSTGAPQWSGIIADANQMRVAARKPRLTARRMAAHEAVYRLRARPQIFDVTAGVNGVCGAICTAGAGYDFVTGVGSPRSGIDLALARAP